MQPKTTFSTLSFSSLLLAEPLLKAISKLGFKLPTPVQQKSIPLALEYKDLLVSAETGSGKTVAFLLPTLHHLLTLPSKKLVLAHLFLRRHVNLRNKYSNNVSSL